MKRSSTAIALVMAVSAGPALAQAAEWTFADIDEDGNLELTETEFERVSREMFRQLDADQDQMLAQEELADADALGTEGEAAWTEWDTDAEAGLGWQEFHTGLFDAYDADEDDIIGEQEFAEVGAGFAEERAALGIPDAERTLQAGEIIAIPEWGYDQFYGEGFSVETFMDEMQVVGITGEEIGDVEDVVFSSDGELIAVIAEVGGFWDIGDTHVSVPWEQVEVEPVADRIILPVTEETVGEYSLAEADYLTAEAIGEEIAAGVDEVPVGPRAWRATELIGDYARLRDGDMFANYGYVNDLIVKDGQLAAVVVQPDVAWGVGGPYAYPYYGWGYGWRPGMAFYDLPYAREDVAELEPFEEERLAY